MNSLAMAGSGTKACPFTNASKDFDPFDLTDPFPFYEYARGEAPVFYSERLGYWVVSRHAEIKAVFENWQTYSSENAQAPFRPMGPAGKAVMQAGGFTAYSGLSARIPPDHSRIRKVAQSCFGPRRFKAIEPQIYDVVNAQIDKFAHLGKVDFFREFAYDVPALVLFKLIGIPDSDVPMVKSWAVSRALLTWGDLTDEEQVPHAHNMVQYWNYCRALVAARHKEMSDDLPGDMVKAQMDGAEITDDEIAGVLYSVLFAGHETTTTLLANSMREVLTHPDAWAKLVANPNLWIGATDEFLRYTPSIVSWRRKALADSEIGGVKIPAGSNLLLLLASGNRDEAVFEHADQLDVTRSNARNHLSLGFGIHYCLGQQLAKLEFGIAMKELARRLPSLRLTPGQVPTYAHNTSFRVPKAVHIEWDVA
jgi:cytochrome P450